MALYWKALTVYPAMHNANTFFSVGGKKTPLPLLYYYKWMKWDSAAHPVSGIINVTCNSSSAQISTRAVCSFLEGWVVFFKFIITVSVAKHNKTNILGQDAGRFRILFVFYFRSLNVWFRYCLPFIRLTFFHSCDYLWSSTGFTSVTRQNRSYGVHKKTLSLVFFLPRQKEQSYKLYQRMV